jgi:hypothetical protein
MHSTPLTKHHQPADPEAQRVATFSAKVRDRLLNDLIVAEQPPPADLRRALSSPSIDEPGRSSDSAESPAIAEISTWSPAGIGILT